MEGKRGEEGCGDVLVEASGGWVGLCCRVAPHWGQGAEPLCPRGLPWDGRVTLLEAALFRRLGPHGRLTCEGCLSSR